MLSAYRVTGQRIQSLLESTKKQSGMMIKNIFNQMPFTIPDTSSCGRISYQQQMKNNYTKNL
jgi:hypothetical protein